MGNIGIWQIVLVLLVFMLLFGAGKLPRVAADLAKGVRGFKRELNGGEEAAADNVKQS